MVEPGCNGSGFSFPTPIRATRTDLARLCSLVVLLRTGELGLLGLFIASGLMETRYAVVALPAMLVVATVGFRAVVEIVGQRLVTQDM